MTTEVLAPTISLSSGGNESAVTIPAEDGCLRGNLIRGPKGADLGLLFVHGWGGIRSGPHDLLTTMARAAGSRGVPSLRFDLRGRGESSGEHADTTLVTMGMDVIAAAAALRRETGVRRLLLVGICSGGNVAIGVLPKLGEVAGLFLLSVYPFSEGDSFHRDAGRTAKYLREYWHKLWRPATWRKLLRGEIFFRQIGRVLFGHYRKDQRRQTAEETAGSSLPIDNLSKYPVPVQMVYGDADPDFAASHQYYADYANAHQLDLQLRTIAGANHNFYSQAWKDELVAALNAFIGRLSGS